MTLEDAAKKVYEEGIEGVAGYNIDGKFVNLDCKGPSGSIYPARLIFDDEGGYTYERQFGSDAPIIFGDRMVELMK